MEKRIKTIIIFAVASMFVSVCAADEYADYLKSQTESFKQYRDERDAEFIGFLKKQWAEFDAHQGLKRDTKPKPVRIPMVRPVQSEPVEFKKSKPIKEIVIPKYVEPKIMPFEQSKPFTVEPNTVNPQPVTVTFDFYGKPFLLSGDMKFPGRLSGPVGKKFITEFWDKMSISNYDAFILQAQKFKKQLRLNDWGYHYFLYRFGMKQFAQDKNMANLFVWFVSSKSGYDSRIGYNKMRIFLLMPSRHRLFSVPFLKLGTQKYYSLGFDGTPEKFNRLFTYKGKYPKANRLMDYRVVESPDFGRTLTTKILKFQYKNKTYKIPAQYSRDLVRFFQYYPQANIKVYFDAIITPQTEYTLVKGLKPLLENKSEAEAVNFLLRFVQKSFRYKTDDGQFGREKYLFLEETLSYPFSDCEDRSIFFAFLVKKLLKLDVIGLDYPGHVATAVKFSDNLPGDYVVQNNTKYMVCDPTYINARLGMAMPKFRRLKPEIVRIDSL